jgi:small Trp-rich protein
MAFLILGILLLALKLAEFGPVGAWSWWVVLLPFGLATAWWAFSDSIGLTQRRAMDKMEEVKAERRNRNLEALGLGTRRDRKARRANQFTASDAGKRAAKDAGSATADQVGRR